MIFGIDFAECPFGFVVKGGSSSFHALDEFIQGGLGDGGTLFKNLGSGGGAPLEEDAFEAADDDDG